MREIICLLFFWAVSSTLALGQTITCWDRNISMVATAFTSMSVAETWYPKYVRLSDESVTWGETNSSWYRPIKNLGDGFPNWESVESGHRWKWKYNRGSNTLTVILSSETGYKTPGPLVYSKCQLAGGSKNTVNRASGQDSFNRLSNCNKRYVQQFLKGQGLYNGTVDGIWGNGTRNGLTRAGQVGKLQGLSNDDIIAKLQDNLVCN